jgi:hypothetical protein
MSDDPYNTLEPYAVPIPEARRLRGNESRSALYDAIGRGELTAIKRGTRTLIVVESIRRSMAALPPAQIAAPKPRRHVKGAKVAL